MIVAVDGRSIKTADDVLDAVESKQPGDVVTITVIRAGQQKQIPLRLEAEGVGHRLRGLRRSNRTDFLPNTDTG